MNVSVIVVSHNRPSWLARCLRALRQLDYPTFEIVVVADSASLANVAFDGIKTIPFDHPNISAARNIGIRHAAGEICAFIDDDAVPEPLWLTQLTRAFAETGADAVVGYVRGRNGISFQSRVASVDIEAETHLEPDTGDAPFVPALKPGRALKLIGTNMAFRRSALVSLCGFDEAFAYFLDDADISLRLAKAGMTAAAAPFGRGTPRLCPVDSPRRDPCADKPFRHRAQLGNLLPSPWHSRPRRPKGPDHPPREKPPGAPHGCRKLRTTRHPAPIGHAGNGLDRRHQHPAAETGPRSDVPGQVFPRAAHRQRA